MHIYLSVFERVFFRGGGRGRGIRFTPFPFPPGPGIGSGLSAGNLFLLRGRMVLFFWEWYEGGGSGWMDGGSWVCREGAGCFLGGGWMGWILKEKL